MGFAPPAPTERFGVMAGATPADLASAFGLASSCLWELATFALAGFPETTAVLKCCSLLPGACGGSGNDSTVVLETMSLVLPSLALPSSLEIREALADNSDAAANWFAGGDFLNGEGADALGFAAAPVFFAMLLLDSLAAFRGDLSTAFAK